MFAHDVGSYFWDLAEHWAAFMTGGIPAAAILLLERIRNKPMPLRAFMLFLAFGFLAAAYQEHRELSSELTALKATNRTMAIDYKNITEQLTESKRQLDEALKRVATPSNALANHPTGNSFKNIHMKNGDTVIRFSSPPTDTTVEGIETENVKHGIDIGIDAKKK